MQTSNLIHYYGKRCILLSLIFFGSSLFNFALPGARDIYDGELDLIEKASDSRSDVSTTRKPQHNSPAKPIHSSPKHNRSSTNSTGIAYWFDKLDSQGRPHRVSANTVFLSGEWIRLNIMPNRNGYLYVMNNGTSGISKRLYPPKSDNESSYVEAYLPYTSKSLTFQFDDRPGTETLLILLVPQPLTNSVNDSLSSPVPLAQPSAISDCEGQNRDLISAVETTNDEVNQQISRCGGNTRDLMTSEEVGVVHYSAFPFAGQSSLSNQWLSTEVKLTHR